MDLSVCHCGYEKSRLVRMEEAVGYPNQLNFSRVFKGVYGISPREYRQRNMITGGR
ncbi:MAG: AraC family transcriptional regulator [Dorea sp.]|jgi:AraC-like DNA-binding protein|nr:AraC family transcriptional regulator [Dorea sp.]